MNNTRQDPQYHRLRKETRLGHLKQVALGIGRCLNTGATFLGQSFFWESAQEFFLRFLISLGVRRVNKFWPSDISQCKSTVT